jgi:hypothetical protein
VQENESAKSVKELERRVRQGRAWLLRRERQRHAEVLQAKDISGLVAQHARTSTFTRRTKARRHARNILVSQLLARGG